MAIAYNSKYCTFYIFTKKKTKSTRHNILVIKIYKMLIQFRLLL